ncbi:MAG: DedA family protein [Solirubrobacteraceae bacterium]
MMEFLNLIKETILNPEWYILNGGFYLILAVVFSETGLMLGFFLPGDSLLIVVGIYSDLLAKQFFNSHYLVMTSFIALAAIIGNFVGYWFGKKYGFFLYNKKDTFYFKQKYLISAKQFYEERGALTIILARFLPIVRTFVPIIAGIVKMDFKKFALYNIVGGILWIFSLVIMGRFFHNFLLTHYNFDLRDHLEILVIVLATITIIPVFYKFTQNKLKN